MYEERKRIIFDKIRYQLGDEVETDEVHDRTYPHLRGIIKRIYKWASYKNERWRESSPILFVKPKQDQLRVISVEHVRKWKQKLKL